MPSNKLKIAFLMQEVRMGGIEYNSVNLAKALREKYEIIFLCPGKGKLTGLLDCENFKYWSYSRPCFFSTSLTVWGRDIFNPFASLYNFLLFPFISLSLSKMIRGGGFHIVFTKGLLANFYGALACKWAGVPCIWDMQEIVSKQKAFGFTSFILDWWARNFVTKVVTSAEAIKEQFSGAVRKKTVVIPNGIDVHQYHPDVDCTKVRKEWNIADNEILVGHIARFTHWKGQKEFVRAAAIADRKMPGLKFVLVGSGVFEGDGYQMEVKQLSMELGLGNRVIFPGFRDDLADVLAGLDIFVHSSIHPEGCPLTLITAMSMAKPVVATDVPGNKEVITSGQGMIVPPSDAEAMADAILKFAADKKLCEELGRESRKRILERFSIDAYAADCERLIHELCVGTS